MAFRKIEGFVEYCELEGIVGPFSRRGCSEAEIAALEDQCKVRLPHSYRTFLATMGHGMGRLFENDHMCVTYDHVLEVNNDFDAYVAREADFPYPIPNLPDDAIVIASRLFDVIWFIRCNDSEESPVWSFWLSRPNERCETESVVEWLYGWAVEAKLLMEGGRL